MLVPIYRIALIRDGSRKALGKQIDSPETAHRILRDFIGPSDRENLAVMTIDAKNRPIGLNLVSVGDLTSSIATPREVYKLAVLQNAASIILAHNHPSGTANVSSDDLAVTERLQKAGKLMGVELLDHIIIGDAEFVSVSEQGLLAASHRLTPTWNVGSPDGASPLRGLYACEGRRAPSARMSEVFPSEAFPVGSADLPYL